MASYHECIKGKKKKKNNGPHVFVALGAKARFSAEAGYSTTNFNHELADSFSTKPSLGVLQHLSFPHLFRRNMDPKTRILQ